MYNQTVIGNFLTQKEQSFPHDCELYENLQQNIFRVSALGNIVGDKAILKGCELQNSNTYRAKGIVFLRTKDYPDGEILYWQGGSILSGMHLKKKYTSISVQDKEFEKAYTIRYLEGGRGDENYDWSDFVAYSTLPEVEEALNAFKEEMAQTIRELTAKDQELMGKDAELENEINKTNAVIGQIQSGKVTAGIARKLETARTVRLEGDLKGESTFDGSDNLIIQTEGVRAAQLTTGRTIKLSGVDATDATFNGTKDITLQVKGVPTNLLTGRIGGLTLHEESLTSDDGKAAIAIGNEGKATLQGNGTIDLQGNDKNLTSLRINSGETPSAKGYAIRSEGNHLFGQRPGEQWNAPGILWSGLIRCEEEMVPIHHWGNGMEIYNTKLVAEGVLQISHNLAHREYTVMAIPYYDSYNTEANDITGQVLLRITNQTVNTFCIRGVDTNNDPVSGFQAMIMIAGRNKWE